MVREVNYATAWAHLWAERTRDHHGASAICPVWFDGFPEYPMAL
jgi:hypothetical protein